MKKVFTLKEFPWYIIMAILLAVDAAALHHNAGHLADVWVQLAVLLVVNLAFTGIVGYYFDLKEVWVGRWNHAYHTHLNTAVVVDLDVSFNLIDKSILGTGNDTANFYDKVAAEVDKSIAFWTKWRESNQTSIPHITDVEGRNADMVKAFDGATINVVKTPPQGMFVGKVMGYQQGQTMVVTFDDNKVKTLDQLLLLIRHEVSHLCLTAVGVDPGYAGSNQHKIFEKTGFC